MGGALRGTWDYEITGISGEHGPTRSWGAAGAVPKAVPGSRENGSCFVLVFAVASGHVRRHCLTPPSRPKARSTGEVCANAPLSNINRANIPNKAVFRKTP